MLLWVLILALFGALSRCSVATCRVAQRQRVGVQAWIAAAFYLFILVTSNPSCASPRAPFEGHDLNPILQDIGLAVHPPLLYFGYVGSRSASRSRWRR